MTGARRPVVALGVSQRDRVDENLQHPQSQARQSRVERVHLMPRALKVCSRPGCPTLTAGGRCSTCNAQADRIRGTATQRGYNSRSHKRFRDQVLDRDPICVLCHLAASTVADHWPLSRRQLEQTGLDPNDPKHGRGLCKRCHDQETARNQPGGWNAGA